MRCAKAVRFSLVAMVLALFVPVASAAEQKTFYLGPDDLPIASLVNSPRGGEMPNFDLGRDTQPGLLLQRSVGVLDEDDETRFQQWQVAISDERLVGYPSVVIWSAPADFDPEMGGEFSVKLLDCSQRGDACAVLSEADVTIERGAGADWVESNVALDEIDHEFGNSRSLAIRVVVSETSESDMMFAYGYPKHRSRLTISTEPPTGDLEVAALAAPAPFADAASDVERTRRLLSPPVSASASTGPGESISQWVVPLGLSTVLLTALGSVLVSRLVRPGRHEQRFVTRRGVPISR